MFLQAVKKMHGSGPDYTDKFNQVIPLLAHLQSKQYF